MSKLKLTLMAGMLAAGLTTGAEAMPVSNLAAVDTAAAPQQVRWVCNAWGRCWWRPGRFYRPYAYYRAPRFYFGPHWRGPRWYGPRWRYRRW